MGSGSSRSGRIPRRRRSPDRRQTGSGETASEGGAADQAPTAAAQEEIDRDPRPATPPGGREETLRLLDQLLAESEAWGPQEPTPRGPARLPPAVSPEKVKGSPEDSCASEAPGNSPKRPEGQSAISYDYSEEELMASIEREYCR
ncbi:cystin-1 [Apodemus sylvaticus]|uniref:cystin-1 n=1 Tax=Apodemus sylvaticus TaxID=10129 RepID=UPI00224424F7|nr:cystin-1 [Apodemus sylvaticus]XP_052042001.1 cystin-1 [Apodemus sylvaticus]